MGCLQLQIGLADWQERRVVDWQLPVVARLTSGMKSDPSTPLQTRIDRAASIIDEAVAGGGGRILRRRDGRGRAEVRNQVMDAVAEALGDDGEVARNLRKWNHGEDRLVLQGALDSLDDEGRARFAALLPATNAVLVEARHRAETIERVVSTPGRVRSQIAGTISHVLGR